MKIQFFKKTASFKKKTEEINPSLYWTFIFCVSLLLMIISFAFGFSLFMEINKETVFSANPNTRVRIIKKERIDKVLQYFSLREQKSNQILNSPSPVVDPSL